LSHLVPARHTIGALTRMMRDLPREHVSSRDLWQILNAILRHDLLPTPGQGLLAAVREALGPSVAFDTGQMAELGATALLVYETDAGCETELVAAHGASADEGARCRIRDRIWSALGASPPPEPVLLTSARVRSLLQK